jgi:hypothetical protein
MKKQFKIYKKGRTDGKVTILSKEGEPFDKTAKIHHYLSLGYRVFDLKNREILSQPIMSKQETCNFFGCTKEQLNKQLKANAAGLQLMADKAKSTGKKVNGYTESQLTSLAAKYKKLAK